MRFLAQLAQGEQLREIIEHTNLKPGEPDALAFAAKSHAVEAVVPIATSDQRQSVRTGGGGASEGAPAMFQQRALCMRDGRNRKALRFFRLKLFAFEKWNRLIQNGGIARGADVMRRDEGKPEQIVTDPGPHASA